MNLFPLSRFVVFGSSMLPKLKPGDNIISFDWFLNPKVGDIVVALLDKRLIIKRVRFIRENKVFLVGDNEKESTDSREIGWIDKKSLVGKVVLSFTT